MPHQTYVAVRRHLARERSGVFVFGQLLVQKMNFFGDFLVLPFFEIKIIK
jgi:hypothetical protein